MMDKYKAVLYASGELKFFQCREFCRDRKVQGRMNTADIERYPVQAAPISEKSEVVLIEDLPIGQFQTPFINYCLLSV